MAIIDLDVFGRNNIDGTGIELTDDEALTNAITVWLTSKQGEFLLEPEEGGPLDSLPFKRLSDIDADIREFELKSRFEEDFGAVAQMDTLIIEPNWVEGTWDIFLDIISLISEEQFVIKVQSKVQEKTKPQLSLIEVSYVADNLIEFVILKKEEQPREVMLFNEVTQEWVFGLYRLINLTMESVEFNTVLSITNG